MSGVTLTDEYAHAAQDLHFSFDELCRLARMGFDAAFLEPDEKRQLLDRVDREFAVLRSEVAP